MYLFQIYHYIIYYYNDIFNNPMTKVIKHRFNENVRLSPLSLQTDGKFAKLKFDYTTIMQSRTDFTIYIMIGIIAYIRISHFDSSYDYNMISLYFNGGIRKLGGVLSSYFSYKHCSVYGSAPSVHNIYPIIYANKDTGECYAEVIIKGYNSYNTLLIDKIFLNDNCTVISPDNITLTRINSLDDAPEIGTTKPMAYSTPTMTTVTPT